jgi:hypothetical protein
MKLFDLSLDEIDLEDERFRFSYHFELDKLLISIKKMGILSPILVVKRDGPLYVVLSGWKRILASRELAIESIPSFWIEENEDGRAFLVSVYENWVIRRFNILEKAEILNKLSGFMKDEKIIVRQFFPLLDIPANLSYLDIYLKIADLDPSWKNLIYQKKLSLPSAELLTAFTPGDKENLLPLLLPLNKNKVKQFIEDIYELSQKTGDSFGGILSTREVRSVLQADNLSSLQKAEKIRSFIHTKRYPNLSAWKNSFETSVKNAQLSKDVVFDSTSFFEDGEFAVNFNLRDREAFRDRIAKLEKLVAEEGLFSWVKGSFDE